MESLTHTNEEIKQNNNNFFSHLS